MRLPDGVVFEDYASLAVSDDRIAVVSQASSALWVAPFSASTLELGIGTMYEFPRDGEGERVDCTVEGVSWLGDHLVFVSDRTKVATQDARCRAKDQSIHLFAIPATESAPASETEPAAVRVAIEVGGAEARVWLASPGKCWQKRRAESRSQFSRCWRCSNSGSRATTPCCDSPGSGSTKQASRLRSTPTPTGTWNERCASRRAIERLPVVHLDRDLDMLRPADRRVVAAFATSFSGRVAGLVVHDKPAMAARQAELVDGMRDLASQLGTSDNGPSVFLEYAAGHKLDWFVEVGELLEDLERVSMCIDVGHIGIRQARRHFAHGHPSLELASLHPGDARLPDLVDDVQAAVGTALPAVLDVTRSLGRLGKPVHFHLHDGHPLVPGLSDHFSFFMRVPIPFEHDHRTSLPPMYGPAGLAAIAVGRRRGIRCDRSVAHPGDPPSRGAPPARRRRRSLRALAGSHQCRADELLAERARRERRAARCSPPRRRPGHASSSTSSPSDRLGPCSSMRSGEGAPIVVSVAVVLGRRGCSSTHAEARSCPPRCRTWGEGPWPASSALGTIAA